jgi:hypothetical protein
VGEQVDFFADSAVGVWPMWTWREGSWMRSAPTCVTRVPWRGKLRRSSAAPRPRSSG